MLKWLPGPQEGGEQKLERLPKVWRAGIRDWGCRTLDGDVNHMHGTATTIIIIIIMLMLMLMLTPVFALECAQCGVALLNVRCRGP